MTPILYLIPCTLGDTDLNNVLPAANASIVTSLKYFIVENIRTARRFLKKVDRNINIVINVRVVGSKVTMGNTQGCFTSLNGQLFDFDHGTYLRLYR